MSGRSPAVAGRYLTQSSPFNQPVHARRATNRLKFSKLFAMATDNSGSIFFQHQKLPRDYLFTGFTAAIHIAGMVLRCGHIDCMPAGTFFRQQLGCQIGKLSRRYDGPLKKVRPVIASPDFQVGTWQSQSYIAMIHGLLRFARNDDMSFIIRYRPCSVPPASRLRPW